MDRKLVISFVILGIAILSCYIAILKNNRGHVDDLVNSIQYDETAIRATVIQSGIDSSTWDDFNPYVYPQKGLGEADRIDELPGQPKVSFRQYSGYVTVDGQTKRKLFYYFAESRKRPTTRPLVLWLAEGNSCSSLSEVIMGLGPYRILSDSATLGLNPYAWNNVANILFLETPIGAGFSYSNTKSDYGLVGDKMTAQDSYTFLINWLERFPAYKNREFYIAGEYLAGHYASQLARIILHKNKNANHTMVINLRGIMVENALLDEFCQAIGSYDFLYNKGVISQSVHQTLQMCEFSDRVESFGYGTQLKCKSASLKLDEDLKSPILAALAHPTCDNSAKPQPESPNNWKFDPKKFDPCTSQYVTTYMNKDQVREALHAKKVNWLPCSNSYRVRKDEETTVALVVKELMASGIRVWLYSGENEVDNCAEGIECVTNALNLNVKTNYTWYNAPNEVGGQVVEYYNMTFVKLTGASNKIPTYAPANALAVFSSFLEGKPLPGAKLKSK